MTKPYRDVCVRHGVEKDVWATDVRRKNGGRWICRICRSGYRKRYRKRGGNRLIRELLSRFKSQPCFDCGIKYPLVVMDADHVKGRKLFNLGDAYSRSVSLVRRELKKCQPVCANCHRIRTHQQRLKNAKNSNR